MMRPVLCSSWIVVLRSKRINCILKSKRIAIGLCRGKHLFWIDEFVGQNQLHTRSVLLQWGEAFSTIKWSPGSAAVKADFDRFHKRGSWRRKHFVLRPVTCNCLRIGYCRGQQWCLRGEDLWRGCRTRKTFAYGCHLGNLNSDLGGWVEWKSYESRRDGNRNDVGRGWVW